MKSFSVRARGQRSARARRLSLLAGAALMVAGLVAIPSTAHAYTLHGYKWRTGNLRIYVGTTSGNYRTAINQASANYTSATDANLSNTTDGGPMFSAAQTKAGATGYEGLTDTYAPLGIVLSAHSIVNTTYLGPNTDVARLKVVWLHELGHGLGINHVSGITHVMYHSASDAFGKGVRNLTSDEIAGINHIY